MACSRPRRSIGAARGEASKPWNTPRSNGSIRSTTADCSNQSGISLPPRPKRATMPRPRLNPWPPEPKPNGLRKTRGGSLAQLQHHLLRTRLLTSPHVRLLRSWLILSISPVQSQPVRSVRAASSRWHRQHRQHRHPAQLPPHSPIEANPTCTRLSLKAGEWPMPPQVEELYHSRFLRHRFEAYAARAAGGGCAVRMAAAKSPLDRQGRCQAS